MTDSDRGWLAYAKVHYLSHLIEHLNTVHPKCPGQMLLFKGANPIPNNIKMQVWDELRNELLAAEKKAREEARPVFESMPMASDL